jgi:hypothetical protein
MENQYSVFMSYLLLLMESGDRKKQRMHSITLEKKP